MPRDSKNAVKLLFLILAAAAVFSAGTVSCRNRSADYSWMKLPETPLFADNEMWGVVKDPYLRISTAPKNEDATVMTLRQGDLVSVLVIQSFDNIYWCRIKYETREGWTLRDNLDIYDSRDKAENGAALRTAPEGPQEP
jgi:hypothetical protein